MTHKVLINKFFYFLITSILFLFANYAHAITENISVSSGIDNAALVNQDVTVYKFLDDGTRKGVKIIKTNTKGELSLDLSGLGIDTEYELKTLPKHGSRPVHSGKISATGSFAFKVANVRVKAVNGLNNAILANHKILAYKQNTDGSSTYFSSATTDSLGFVDFQLSDIASQPYLFKAASLTDGRTWESEAISSAGTSNFVIGNKLLNVTVSSGIDNSPLAAQEVILYQLSNSGTRQWYRSVTTDSNGQLTLNLPGLGSDIDYELRTQSKQGSLAVFSGKISATGNFAFKVANVQVKAIDGLTNHKIAGHKITAYKQKTDGSFSYVSSTNTDASGLADFQLDNISSQAYLFKAASLSDGRIWESELITSSGVANFVIGNKLLNVTVSSGVDNAPLTNQVVTLYQLKTDGSRQSLRTVSTDSKGGLVLDLPGLGIDTNYELKTLPKHGSREVYSGKISATGSFAFKVANIRIKAIDGRTNKPMAEHKVLVYKQNTEGSTVYFSSVITDASGLADIQLADIASQPYLFKAASLSDGRIWDSELITSTGTSNFVIGNKLLNVAITSGIDNAPLANQLVTLYQLKADGSRQSIRTITTNNQGLLALDLPGLGIDTNYELKTLPKHGSRPVYSGKILATGSFAFKVANVRIKAVNGLNNAILANHKILAYKQNTDGSSTYFSSATTDSLGFVDFQLSDIASQPYLFKAASLSDGRTWESELISSAGTSNFMIGNKLLNVTVSSGIDNSPLAAQEVILYQLPNSGTRQWYRSVTTDSNGQLTLNLPGLGSDIDYELRTQSKQGSLAVFSGKISATGNFAFKVANVQVKAIDGLTNNKIAGHKVIAYKQKTDGSFSYVSSTKTDASGLADFQLDNISSQTYLFKAASLSDGRIWESELITSSGVANFVIGNKLLNVTVSSGVDNAPLTNQVVTLYQLKTDGSRQSLRTVSTDSKGALALDLPGLGIGTDYELKTLPKHGSREVYSGKISATGSFAFKVANIRIKAIDGRTNKPMAEHKVLVYKQNTEGSTVYFASVITDASGLADIQLADIASQPYIFKAASLSDGRIWNSEVITAAGVSNFVIGNKLLNVAITSGIDNAPLANQLVTLYQLKADGSRQSIRTVTTDNQGHLALDLPGLGIDTDYELKTLPKHGAREIYSGKISATGTFAFKVANVRIKAINGQNNSIMANHKISVYKQNPDGSTSFFASLTTNASGLADIDLIDITSQAYLFKAVSLSDGRTWKSKIISSTGTSTFVIGNKLLNVAVTSGIDNTPLANQAVVLYQLKSDGSRQSLRSLTTDSKGLLALDLPGLGSDTDYELKTLPKHGSHVVFSGKISATGNFAFKVANVRVKAINGQTNNIIANHKIMVYKHNSSSLPAVLTTETDASGFVDIQLDDISSQSYMFRAASLSDGRIWDSGIISSAGVSNFVIGNKLLNISLVNALENTPLPNIEVTAYIRMPDNSLKWAQKNTTNSNGQLNMDLEGLGSGTNYVLSSSPYGIKILSKDITSTKAVKIEAGLVAVILQKESNNSIIQNHKLSLYEKIAPGEIEWRASAVTNLKGEVHFDPEGLATGRTYLIVANNIFGNSQNYYSQWVTSKGKFNFSVDPSDPHKLDEEAPVFYHTHPTNNAILADKGFELKLQISDNNTVKQVTAIITDPIKGPSLAQATQSNNEWVLAVTEDMLSKNQTITVKAEAIDQSGNKATANYQYSIINDIEKPILSFTSHKNGHQIDEKGFFLTGTVTDNTGEVKLLATVIDPIKGILINKREIEIGKNNHWALIAKDLSRGQEVIVELESTDSASNTSHDQLVLSVMTESSNMIQLINRITYGATPELLKELREFGTDNFIQQQLHPELIDDSDFEQQFNKVLTNDTSSYKRLHDTQIVRAISSKRQLLEIMTQFWESHFNTDLKKVNNVSHEELEHELFRQHALGNFRDLLQISATSPAMLKYLDNIESYKDEPNENYARELMELHTLGVDNNYTSKDIAEVARVFTGWGINGGAFYFAESHHDNNEKTVLGTVIHAGSGISGGELVLDLLAQHNATANFICTKLLKTFVSDHPKNNAIAQCASDYLTNINEDDQIALILEGIFKSNSFSESLSFHNKIKTPLELLIGLYRQLPISINLPKTRSYLIDMDMPLYYYPLPTGWPEMANELINSNQLIQRWQLTNNILFNSPSQWASYFSEPDKFLINKGIETTEGVLGYLFEITLAHDYSELEWAEGLSLLTNNQTEKFDIYAPDAEIKIRNLIAFILQYPSYQLQ